MNKDIIIKDIGEILIAFAGNPNVGKSTVFNSLTGLHQHTGNWTGKTVSNAFGKCTLDGTDFLLVDLPGAYSLLAHSSEEEAARDFLLFEKPDVVCVVCDATCLERNLNLVLQILEISNKVIVCVNLLDEAKKNGIHIDLDALSQRLGVPVIGAAARSGIGTSEILEKAKKIHNSEYTSKKRTVDYPDDLNEAVDRILPFLQKFKGILPLRWLAVQLLLNSDSLMDSINRNADIDFNTEYELNNILKEEKKKLGTEEDILDKVVGAIMRTCEMTASAIISNKEKKRIKNYDKIFTSRILGYPIMLFMLAVIMWITIIGANYPSKLLSTALFYLEDRFDIWFDALGISCFFTDMLIHGMYRVMAWVVSVMLPPMAVFFPLFTILEDLGYLPRVAFNLDNIFKRCHACGKQALTMCMGFGCNAVGVSGAKIIDSKRERLIAILTNAFVPCNGRFPALISLITLFFAAGVYPVLQGAVSALILTGIIAIGILMTFLISFILSKTLLKGETSTVAIELPPFRRPQIGKVIVRSILDRTIFVLGRAVIVAAPTGIVIYCLANFYIGNSSVLLHISTFLDPFAHLFGLDGVILMAFILGLPANEIVIPIVIMCYTASANLTDISSGAELYTLFTQNGWTVITAVCTSLFCLMHWPCSTTLLTVKKETGSLKYTALAFLIPTVCGLSICLIVNTFASIFM